MRLSITHITLISLLSITLMASFPAALYAVTTGESNVNPRLVMKGSTFTITLTLTTDDEISLMQPAFPAPDGVTLTNRIRNESILSHVAGSGTEATHTFTAEYLADDEGIFQIGPFRIAYSDEQAVSHEISMEPVTVEVYEDAPRPPSTIISGNRPWWINYLIVAGLLAFLGALAAAWYMIRRRSHPDTALLPLITFTRSHEQVAYDRIKELPIPEPLDENAVKTYYDSVDDILRKYLTQRYEIDTGNVTLWEIKREFHRRKRLDNRLKDVFVLLNDCDWVKFARSRPLAGDIRGIPGRAHEILLGSGPDTSDT